MSADDSPVPQMRLSANPGGINCLMLSPMSLIGLGLGGALNGSLDGTGITCKGTNPQTGQDSEMPVFQGHQVNTNSTIPNDISISGLVKLIKINTPELAEIPHRQIDSLVSPNQLTERIFDNFRMAVATCGSPSRFYNRCYLTGRNYSESESDALTGRVFSGAKATYGDRFYLVSFQYSLELEHIFPVVDTYFNIMNMIVSLVVAAPGLMRINDGRGYYKCQIRRTNGLVQTGFIQLNNYSMLIYKSKPEEGPGLIPYITVYFNSNGKDIQDVDCINTPDRESLPRDADPKTPDYDCFKTIRLMDLFAENPGVKDLFLNDLRFENLCIRSLYELIKDEQQ